MRIASFTSRSRSLMATLSPFADSFDAGRRNIGIYPSDRRLNIRQHGNSLLFADIR